MEHENPRNLLCEDNKEFGKFCLDTMKLHQQSLDEVHSMIQNISLRVSSIENCLKGLSEGIVSQAAASAVVEVFKKMEVDVSDVKDLREFLGGVRFGISAKTLIWRVVLGLAAAAATGVWAYIMMVSGK